MPHDQLRTAIDAIRAQIQAELDAQLTGLERQHGEALEVARQTARAETDARWSEELKRAQAEWETRLRTEVADAVADGERRLVMESSRGRAELEEKARELSEARQQIETLERDVADLHARIDREAASARNAIEAESSRAGSLAGELEATQRALEEARRAFEGERDALHRAADEARSMFDSERDELHRVADEARRTYEAERDELYRVADEARRTYEAERDELHRVADEARRTYEAERDELHRAADEARRAFDAERQELRRALDAAETSSREAIERERAAARQAIEAQAERHRREGAAEARAAERQSQLAVTERLLQSVREISGARSLTDALTILGRGAAAEASRAAVFVPRGSKWRPVSASGFDTAFQSEAVPSQAGDTLQTAWRQNATVTITLANAPPFASQPENRAGLVVPLTVGGEPVALLYVDNNLAAETEVPASWPEAVEILAGHASAVLAQITAMRTSQAVPFLRGSVPESSARRRQAPVVEAGSEEDQAARRYARLLVSEIKLYNESAVRLGREKRDLLSRLQPEVERARRLYEQRVPSTVAKRELYFDQEVCQTLAEGDTSLLGNPAVMP